MKDVRDALFVAHASDGKLVRRPMSPHLGIYRFQLSMFLSIANRISGVATSFGTLLMVWWLVAGASGVRPFATAQGFIGSPIGLIVLCGWTLALVFHTVSGIRHLTWDAGYGFSKPVFNRVGVIVLATSIVLTVLILAIGFSLWSGVPTAAATPAPTPAAGS